MITEKGKLKIADATETAVPVNIFICPEKDEWVLTAECLSMDFETRLCRFEEKAYHVTADTKEELVSLMNIHALVLYPKAQEHYDTMRNKKHTKATLMWNYVVRDTPLDLTRGVGYREAIRINNSKRRSTWGKYPTRREDH